MGGRTGGRGEGRDGLFSKSSYSEALSKDPGKEILCGCIQKGRGLCWAPKEERKWEKRILLPATVGALGEEGEGDGQEDSEELRGKRLGFEKSSLS